MDGFKKEKLLEVGLAVLTAQQKLGTGNHALEKSGRVLHGWGPDPESFCAWAYECFMIMNISSCFYKL